MIKKKNLRSQFNILEVNSININRDKHEHDFKNLSLEYREFLFGVADTKFCDSL